MGRHDFRPLSVHRLTSQLMEAGRIDRKSAPPWYDVVGRIPPSQTLVRTQPLPHQQRDRRPKTKKASRLFQPKTITYEEDKLRREFFGDHPWELARPRMVIENDGKDSHRNDWSRIRRPDQAFNGENVVQRQIWLRQHDPEISEAGAYDHARKEFYEHRLLEDTERRVAREEALHTGAQFGPSAMEIGMQLENEEYERWKAWAMKEAERTQQRQAAMYTGTETGSVANTEPGEELKALEAVSDSIPVRPAARGAVVQE